jgi:hypothetical protein
MVGSGRGGMSGKPGKVRVLYVAGYPRSGSTLLLRLLAGEEGFVGVGELYDVWQRSFIEDHLCGCGRRFGACPFWREVTARVFGDASLPDAAAYEEVRNRVQSTRFLPWLLIPRLRPSDYRMRLASYGAMLGRVYEAIRAVSKADVLVESSKLPAYALLLSEVPSIEMHVVHLVRDSRATAFSWQRRKLRPEIHWRAQYMDRISPTRTAAEWTAINLLLGLVRNRAASYSRLHYEDFVARPRKAAEAISRQVGLPRDFAGVVDDRGFVRFGIDHTVSGNPTRFRRGHQRIALDDEWREHMPRRDFALVTTISAPLLLAYGYPPRRQEREPSIRDGEETGSIADRLPAGGFETGTSDRFPE